MRKIFYYTTDKRVITPRRQYTLLNKNSIKNIS